MVVPGGALSECLAAYDRARTAGERTIDAGTPGSRQMAEGVRRAVRCPERLNALPYDDREAIGAAWSEVTGQPVDPTLHLIPPVCSDCGLNLRMGRNIFVSQGCRLDDIGGIELGDDVMPAPASASSARATRSTRATPTPGHRSADRHWTQRLDRRRCHHPPRRHDRRRRRGGRQRGCHR